MQKNILICLMILFAGFSSLYSQTEERPANGPRGVVNVRDELRRRQGPWSFYNGEGDLLNRTEYVNDKKEGLSTVYYPGGGPNPEKIREETYYFAGKKDSISVKKYLSGQLQVEGSYDMGKKDGKWTAYYEDGQIRFEGAYKAGKRDGEWKFYNRKGVLVKSTNFVNGVDGSSPKPAAKGDKKGDKKGGAAPSPAKK
jgi:antitoxin component YwqK of YwqJK toxin-antitoxin module